MKDWLSRSALRVEGIGIIKSIKDGFAGIMPVLLIGAFIHMLVRLDLFAHLDGIPGFPGRNWDFTFAQISHGVLGIIPVAVVFSISYTLAQRSSFPAGRVLSPLVPALVGVSCLFILVAIPDTGFAALDADFADFGGAGIFLAVFIAVTSHYLFFFFCRFRLAIVRPRAATTYLAQVVLLLEPVLFTILIFGIVRLIFNGANVLDIPGFLYDRIVGFLAGIYNRFSSPLAFVIFFTFFSQFLWFFGLHSGDVAGDVYAYVGGSEVLCQDFFQLFVFTGGGGALALIFAILVIRWKNAMRPALFSLPMGIANIGTPVLYGLPVLFNPLLLIPFIFAPIFSGIIAHMAVSAGMSSAIIPDVVAATMPPGISGWMATGSAMAGVVQVIGLVLGTFIYLPFAWAANNSSEERADFAVEQLMSRDAAPYLARKDDVGVFANSLFEEMEYDLRRRRGFYLEYHPMTDSHNRMLSFEARARYRHMSLGPLPKELVQALVEEGRLDSNLNAFVIEEALSSLQSLREYGFTDLLMTINLSPKQLSSPKTIKMMQDNLRKYNIDPAFVRIELSAHEVLGPGCDPWTLFDALEPIGLRVIINNFTLQLTHFNNLRRLGVKAIKLGNALTHDVQYNKLSANVIKDIVKHSKPMTIIADEIESKAQRDLLAELGCEIFQGKHFSKPMEAADLALYLRLK